MKILNLLIIPLFVASTVNAAERDWKPINDKGFLDINSIVVTENPKLVKGDLYIENPDTKKKLLWTMTVNCTTNSYYNDEILKSYTNDLILIGSLKNPDYTKKNPKKINKEAIPSALLTLCDDSTNISYRESGEVKRLKYDRNSSGQLYKLIKTDDWNLFYRVYNGTEVGDLITKDCEEDNKTKAECKSAVGLIVHYGSLNIIPDDYRYQNNPNNNIKQLALDGKINTLKTYKLYSTWAMAIYEKAELNNLSDKFLSQLYALVLFTEDATGRVVGGITN